MPVSETISEIAAHSWLSTPVLEVAGASVTLMMILRALLIIVAIVLALRVSRQWLDRASETRPDMARSGWWILAKIFKWGLIVVGVLLVLNALGLDLSKATLIMSALTVGIGFGLQNVVNNFVSGLILMVERSIRIGDWIEVGPVQGIVKQINMRFTVVMTFDRAEVIVPNSDMLSKPVTNWTLLDRTGRIVINLEILPGPDVNAVCEVLRAAACANSDVCQGPDPAGPVARVIDTGQRGINFRLQCFVDDVLAVGGIRAELLADVLSRLREADMHLAFANSAAPVVVTDA